MAKRNINDKIAYFYTVIKNMDRNDERRRNWINAHETTFDEYFYESLSGGTSLDGKIAEQSLLGWIELIENENLHKAVKSLSIEDQIFISYIVKEQRTQRELAVTWGISQLAINLKFNNIKKLKRKIQCFLRKT